MIKTSMMICLSSHCENSFGLNMPEQIIPLYRTVTVKGKTGKVYTVERVYKRITIVYPITYNCESYYGYGICKEDGTIWSSLSGFWKQMTPSVSGKSPYPKINVSINGKPYTMQLHIAVHETLNPILPKPENVTYSDWKITPCSVKTSQRPSWEVNHIDHCHTNFHPKNLEWVTGKQNARAYQRFLKKSDMISKTG